MDLLGELLLSVRVDANSLGVFHSSADWGLDFPLLDRPAAVLYGVLSQPCWLIRNNHPSMKLEVGDSVLVLRDTEIGLASDLEKARTPFMDMWRDLNLPADLHSRSRRSTPIHFGFDPTHSHPKLITVACVLHEPDRNQLLSSLPDVMVLPGNHSSSSLWSAPTLDWLVREAASPKPGFLGAATALMNFLLTSFLRDYVLLIPEGESGWLKALTDPRLGRALVAIHSQSELDWSVGALAAEAKMSRATFCRRFTALLGQSPGQYLIVTRIHHAARELLKGGTSVADLAERYGYRSESAFRTAFKHHLGMNPREYLQSRNKGSQ